MLWSSCKIAVNTVNTSTVQAIGRVLFSSYS